MKLRLILAIFLSVWLLSLPVFAKDIKGMKDFTIEKGKKWKVGDVYITPILDNEEALPAQVYNALWPGISVADKDIAWLIPDFFTPDKKFRISICSFLIQYKGKSILVDTGENTPGGSFEKSLLAAGYRPEDIDYVIFTHLHPDHLGRNAKMGTMGTLLPTFPKARYLFGKRQYEHWKRCFEDPVYRKTDHEGDKMVMPYYLHIKSIADMGLMDLMEDDFTMMDGVISLKTTNGHTPGHSIVVIKSKDDTAWMSGDIFHNPIQLNQPDVSAIMDNNRKLASEERKGIIKELADSDILVFTGHFVKPYGVFVISTPEGYRLR